MQDVLALYSTPSGLEYSGTLKGFMMNPVIPGKAFGVHKKSEAGK